MVKDTFLSFIVYHKSKISVKVLRSHASDHLLKQVAAFFDALVPLRPDPESVSPAR